MLSKKNNEMWGFLSTPTGFNEAESNPVKTRASSATLNAQSTATELSRDPDVPHNVAKSNLMAPQPKVR